MAIAGSISIFLSFVVSIYVLIASVLSARLNRRDFLNSAKNGVISICLLLIIAAICLINSLVNLDFSLKYVALNTSTDLPMIYRVTALWAGQAGSLLLWSLVLSIFSAMVVIFNRNNNTKFYSYVITTLAAVSFFFIFLIAFVENPFQKLPFIPDDGRGLNPILQNGYMAIHPLTLYIGYVGVTIPFAFAMGALLSGKIDDEWIKNSRKWILFAWTFLSMGLLLGARWAYLELGWGGYWAWDPVENAAFMPWLAGTAFLHSVMIQERKKMLKKWNLILIILTFFFAIFGTFITRSGIISSVHSFAQSDIGPLFLGFIAFILLFSFGILWYRNDQLKSEDQFESILSRESAFIFNNLLFLSIAFVVFLGTIFPILSEVLTGEKILVGPPYFNKVNVPIGLALIFLMGVGPLISWRKASKENLIKNFLFPITVGVSTSIVLLILGMREAVAVLSYSLCAFVLSTVFIEFYRGVRVRSGRGENYLLALTRLVSKNKRRYGGYIIHIGVALIVIGITSSSVFVTQREVTLSKNETVEVGKYTIAFNGLQRYENDAKNATAAYLTIYKGSDPVGQMVAEKNIYKYEGNREINQETEVGLRSTLMDDLYITLTNFNNNGKASFRIMVNSMVSWIWLGGMVVLFGAIITMWPAPFKRRQESIVRYNLGADDSTAKV